MRILIIDDEQEIRLWLTAVLQDEGYEAIAVSNGFEALLKLETQKFDIVITDYMLPDLDGMAILTRVRENFPETIVVMITAHSSVEMAVEAMKIGADDYVPKPISPEEILMKLTKAIEIKQIKNENQLFHRRLEKELETARKIQQSLLPQQAPIIQGFDIGIFNQPAKQVGGDYHDIIQLPSNEIGIAIGDVSGKGMPAALLMANIQASLRRCSEAKHSPKEIMFRINNALCPICQFIDEHRFITLFCGTLNFETRNLVYCNAGHNYPIIFRRNKAMHSLSDASGLPCGIVENLQYEESQIMLETGDVLVFYTDGITEAMNSDDKIFSEEKLIDIISNNLNFSSGDLVNHIHEELEKFVGNTNQFDDMTLMVLKVLP